MSKKAVGWQPASLSPTILRYNVKFCTDMVFFINIVSFIDVASCRDIIFCINNVFIKNYYFTICNKILSYHTLDKNSDCYRYAHDYNSPDKDVEEFYFHQQ